MIAIVGGLGAAVGFAAATLLNSRASRIVAPPVLLAWVMLVGLAITLPVALADRPDSLAGDELGLLAASGLGNVAGLLLSYMALRLGRAGVVAPIISTEGALAAVVAVVAGETLQRGAGFLLGAIALGVWLAGSSREGGSIPAAPTEAAGVVRREAGAERQGAAGSGGAGPRGTGARSAESRAVLFALGAAVCFGVSLYTTGRISEDLPIGWALIPARVVGTLFVALPLALTGGLRIPRAAVPLALGSACCEVAGFASYAIGSRDGIAIAAVISSQFGAIAALAAVWLFKERLGRVQVVGIAVIAMGVGALSAVQA